MHEHLEQHARRFADLWFRRNHQDATHQEAQLFAATRWPDFLDQAAEARRQDQPEKLVDLFDVFD
jgi:hypothetical protein